MAGSGTLTSRMRRLGIVLVMAAIVTALSSVALATAGGNPRRWPQARALRPRPTSFRLVTRSTSTKGAR
jgi:hypothetical protein